MKLKLKKLYLISFAEILKTIVEKCDHRYYYILSKILMYKVAQKIAINEQANFLITGENLAQVSSQTLASMHSISSQIDMMILRPLLCFDKQEIVDLAEKIGTFEISKGPEMCSLLGPKNPITKARLHLVEKELAKLDAVELIEQSLEKDNVEIICG